MKNGVGSPLFAGLNHVLHSYLKITTNDEQVDLFLGPLLHFENGFVDVI
jgi:hypothetical protein